MTRIVLIRHGETDWNAEGRYQGQADPPLNMRGLEQAKQLADELCGVGLEVIYSSPLQRALQTAQVLSRHLDIAIRTEPRLMEIHQGEWEGLLQSEISTGYAQLFQKWTTNPWSTNPPGGESLEQVQKRVYAAVEDILACNAGRCIGLVTHRIPIALIKLCYQELALDIVGALKLPNAYWEEIRI